MCATSHYIRTIFRTDVYIWTKRNVVWPISITLKNKNVIRQRYDIYYKYDIRLISCFVLTGTGYFLFWQIIVNQSFVMFLQVFDQK